MYCFVSIKREDFQNRGLSMRCKGNEWSIVIEYTSLILTWVTTIRCTPTLFHYLEITLSFCRFFTALLLFELLSSFFCYPELNEIYHLNHILFVTIYAFEFDISGMNKSVCISFYQPNFKGNFGWQEKTFTLLLLMVTLIWLWFLIWLSLLKDSHNSWPGKLGKLGGSDWLRPDINCCLFDSGYHR